MNKAFKTQVKMYLAIAREELARAFRKELREFRLDTLLFTALFAAPVFFTVLFSWYYSAGTVKSVPMAVLDLDNTSLSRQIIQKFAENEKFDVRYYVDCEEEINELFTGGAARMAIVIPENFTRDFKTGKTAKVLVMCNENNLIVGNSALSRASEILLSMGVGMLEKKFEAAGYPPQMAEKMAQPVGLATRALGNPTYNYGYFLLPGLFGMIFLEISILNISRTIAVDAEQLDRRRLFWVWLAKTLLYWLVFMADFFVNFYLMCGILDLSPRGKLTDVFALTVPFIFDCLAIGSILGILSKSPTFCVQFTAFLSMPLFLSSGFTWPYYLMPLPIKAFARVVPVYAYINPLRDVLLLGSGREDIGWAVNYLWLLAFVLIAVTILVIRREGETTAKI